MKASELIQRLQNLMTEHGDLEVFYTDYHGDHFLYDFDDDLPCLEKVYIKEEDRNNKYKELHIDVSEEFKDFYDFYREDMFHV